MEGIRESGEELRNGAGVDLKMSLGFPPHHQALLLSSLVWEELLSLCGSPWLAMVSLLEVLNLLPPKIMF